MTLTMQNEIWERGYTEGSRDMLAEIAHDLDEICDDDGSLSGGDCVAYIYQLLERGGAVETCKRCSCSIPTGNKCRFCAGGPIELELSSNIDIIDGRLVGLGDDLLLLARNIHDIIEGESA